MLFQDVSTYRMRFVICEAAGRQAIGEAAVGSVQSAVSLPVTLIRHSHQSSLFYFGLSYDFFGDILFSISAAFFGSTRTHKMRAGVFWVHVRIEE